MIHIIRSRASKEQMDEMLQPLRTFVKLAVDVRPGILAGGGVLHADCESALLQARNQQEDIWGTDLNPLTQQVAYESLINIRPHQNNRSVEVLDPALRARMVQIVQDMLGGV